MCKMLTSVLLVSFFLCQVWSQDTCKRPYVEQRLLYDDVQYASPFYVIALPKTPQTVEMDNICYTYFEKEKGSFFHVMSITYKNGTYRHHDFSKGDIINRMGIAEAKSNECVYHDYTLKPICNVTVFILYRCYIDGQCSNNIDIGPIPGVDVRVTLAANPKISPECQAETQSSLRDTSALAGGDYVLLPQQLTPNCITKYDNLVSIGEKKALGPKTATSGLTDRFAENQPSPSSEPGPNSNTQGGLSQSSFFQKGVPPPSAFNPYGRPANGANAQYPTPTNTPSSGYGGQTYAYGNSYSYSTKNPGQTPSPVWPPNNMQRNPPQWNGQGQTVQPGAETHYHIWQSSASAAALKNVANKNNNVHYHIHSWEQPAGCCKCL